MINCIVIDDEPLARELLETHISEVPFIHHLGSFKNAVLASDFMRQHAVDLIFLDIQMPMLTGIDFLKSLQNPPAVIFTTAYREYAVESYELQVLDYLVKPIAFDRFFKAVTKLQTSGNESVAQERDVSEKATSMFVSIGKKQVKLVFDTITYIESRKDYLKIHSETGSLVIKERISAFVEELPADQFLRIHRSYIVNRKEITAFTQNDVEIGSVELPIGGLYKISVLKILKG